MRYTVSSTKPSSYPTKPSWRSIARDAIAAMVGATLAFPDPAAACTSFLIRTADHGAVYGRTMEFAFELRSNAIVIPRHYALTASGPGGKPGMSWTAKFAAVGINGLGVQGLLDGLNEKGLAGGILYFPDFASYADPARADLTKSLAPWDFLTWALTHFATVAEVKAAINAGHIAVVDVVQETLKITPPLHYTLHDASGASLVVEPMGGTLKVHDNPLGVLTNSPPFDWHLTNMRNYVKVSPFDAPPLKVGGETLMPLGQGSGLLGIPGDPTPPSRFVRALGYALSADKKPSGIESVRLAEHILNNFDIPKGWIRHKEEDHVPMEYTQWSTIADLTTRVYYIKTYEDQVLRAIDLKSADLDATSIISAPLKPALASPALPFSKR